MRLSRALPSFDDPVELLLACHDNVRRFTRLLEQLASRPMPERTDEAGRRAAAQVLNYFDRAAPHHHADEEEDLFPRLRALGDPALTGEIDRLEAEHRHMGEVWRELRRELLALSEGRPAGLDAAPAFAVAYREHAAFEDAFIYPAAQALDAAELDRMGQSMAERRGAPRRPDGGG